TSNQQQLDINRILINCAVINPYVMNQPTHLSLQFLSCVALVSTLSLGCSPGSSKEKACEKDTGKHVENKLSQLLSGSNDILKSLSTWLTTHLLKKI
ncbi:hypothetical protein, partial [Fulvivirga kasyanovii]